MCGDLTNYAPENLAKKAKKFTFDVNTIRTEIQFEAIHDKNGKEAFFILFKKYINIYWKL